VGLAGLDTGTLLKHFILAALLGPVFTNTAAQVVVKDAWVRATVPQQRATGTFTAPENVRLVDAPTHRRRSPSVCVSHP
jgi:copper(I)-binding protein